MEEGAEEEEEETTDEDEDEEARRDDGSPPIFDIPTPLPIKAGGWPRFSPPLLLLVLGLPLLLLWAWLLPLLLPLSDFL